MRPRTVRVSGRQVEAGPGPRPGRGRGARSRPAAWWCGAAAVAGSEPETAATPQATSTHRRTPERAVGPAAAAAPRPPPASWSARATPRKPAATHEAPSVSAASRAGTGSPASTETTPGRATTAAPAAPVVAPSHTAAHRSRGVSRSRAALTRTFRLRSFDLVKACFLVSWQGVLTDLWRPARTWEGERVDWDERLFAYLDDLERRPRRGTTPSADGELADRARAEYAAVTLAGRLMASAGQRVVLEVRGAGRSRACSNGSGSDWCLLDSLTRDWVVRLAHVVTVEGASERSVPEVAWSPVDAARDRLGAAQPGRCRRALPGPHRRGRV